MDLSTALSKKTADALKNDQIYTLEDLTRRTRRQVDELPNVGKAAMAEIDGLLSRHNLSFVVEPVIPSTRGLGTTISVDDEARALIEAARGDEPIKTFVSRLIKTALGEGAVTADRS